MNILETKNIFYWTIIIGTLFQIAMLPLVLWINTSNIIVGTSLLICLVVCGTTLLLALLSVVTLLIYQKNKLEFEKNNIDKERSECEYLSKRDQEIANERYSINQQFSEEKREIDRQERFARYMKEILMQIKPPKGTAEWPDKARMNEILRLLAEYSKLLNKTSEIQDNLNN